jgi:hypothetical protein
MTLRLSLILCLLTGCATTPLPQTAREGTPLAPLSVQAVSVAPTLGISTASGLQSAYTASAKLTTNIFDESSANLSSLIQVQGTIVLTKPLRIASGAVTVPIAGTAEAQLTWLGEEPPIVFISNNGGPSKGVRFSHVNIYAPNARSLWEWDTATHTGSAYDLTVEDCTLTTNKGAHINLNAPGPGGRAYNWRFSNILIAGTGQIAKNDNAHAAPIIHFDCIRCVNKQLTGAAFDLWNASGKIENCWLELFSTTVLSERGSYSTLRWENNYIEPHGAPANGELVRVDGTGCVLSTDAIYFVMPTQRVTVASGGQVVFAGPPDCTDLSGRHPDWTQPMEGYAELLQSCFPVSGNGSQVAWPAGRVDQRGVFNVNQQPATQPSN